MTQRLHEIRALKKHYANKMEKSENIGEMLNLKLKIDELTNEEKDILRRCDVEI